MKQIAGDPGLPGTATSREGKEGLKARHLPSSFIVPAPEAGPGLTSE